MSLVVTSKACRDALILLPTSPVIQQAIAAIPAIPCGGKKDEGKKEGEDEGKDEDEGAGSVQETGKP